MPTRCQPDAMKREQQQGPKQLPMVGWFDPGQLMQTAVQVFVSTIFGRHADHRLIEAVTQAHETERPARYPAEGDDPEEFWFDYTADVGDGWNSTYAVAFWISREQLDLRDGSGSVHRTRRGRFLVLGGDEVYPTASRRAYEERLRAPYETALRKATPSPHVFAIPGNHDWYDSLASFSRFFMGGKNLGAWQTRQRRSYFAIHLPHRWWLLGIDVQLGSDVDVMQERYFRDVALHHIKAGDRIILCTAEPEWVNEKIYANIDEAYAESTLRHFERTVLKPHHVSVFVAGDLHHYRRHEEVCRDGKPPRQKITAGGGGAFLHPTHNAGVDKLTAGGRTYTRECAYPDENLSTRLCFGNLLFPLRNPKFIGLAGMVYLFTALSMRMEIPPPDADWTWAAKKTCWQYFESASFTFWVVSLLGGFVMFTDTHSRLYRWAGGLLHGCTHLLATFVLGWSTLFAARALGAPMAGFGRLIGWYVLPAGLDLPRRWSDRLVHLRTLPARVAECLWPPCKRGVLGAGHRGLEEFSALQTHRGRTHHLPGRHRPRAAELEGAGRRAGAGRRQGRRAADHRKPADHHSLGAGSR